MREEALDMGGLFGVLTEPVEANRSSGLPGVVLHNIGVNSHIGADRMYVRMARRWAAQGFRVLRFDSSGLGDSPANGRVAENRVYSGAAIRNSRRVMDFLGQARGLERFVLMGLCSGAYVAFHSAAADPRVVGIVLMNIQLFHWKDGDPVDVRMRDVVKSTEFYSRAIVGRETWVRVLRGQVNVGVIARGLLQKGVDRARLRIARAVHGEGDVAGGFRSMVRRGTDVLLLCGAFDGGAMSSTPIWGPTLQGSDGSEVFASKLLKIRTTRSHPRTTRRCSSRASRVICLAVLCMPEPATGQGPPSSTT